MTEHNVTDVFGPIPRCQCPHPVWQSTIIRGEGLRSRWWRLSDHRYPATYPAGEKGGKKPQKRGSLPPEGGVLLILHTDSHEEATRTFRQWGGVPEGKIIPAPAAGQGERERGRWPPSPRQPLCPSLTPLSPPSPSGTKLWPPTGEERERAARERGGAPEWAEKN